MKMNTGICNLLFEYPVAILLVWLVSFVQGQVEIMKPYHPLYVKSGDTLELICNATNRLQLEWVRQTPSTSWRDTRIEPFVGSEFVTKHMIEEPTGYVETTLIKKNMVVHDRGMYMCRDKLIEHTFAVWVTVLRIIKTPDTRILPNDHFLLACSITGFDNNLPRLEYEWSLNEQTIEPRNTKYLYGSPEEGRITLNVTNPVKSDGGKYECTFFVTTSLGPLSFTEIINIDGISLPTSRGQSQLQISSAFMIILQMLLLCMCP